MKRFTGAPIAHSGKEDFFNATYECMVVALTLEQLKSQTVYHIFSEEIEKRELTFVDQWVRYPKEIIDSIFK